MSANKEEKHMEKSKRLIPDSKVCERYGVVPYTLWRWDHDEQMGFPKPVRINKRKHRFEDELDQFDARLAAERDVEVSAA
jgi:predicted DNA-binding transcriptional regulator AlpA